MHPEEFQESRGMSNFRSRAIRLRAAVDAGLDQLARGEGTEYDKRGLRELGARIKAEGRLLSRSRSLASAKQGKKAGA